MPPTAWAGGTFVFTCVKRSTAPGGKTMQPVSGGDGGRWLRATPIKFDKDARYTSFNTMEYRVPVVIQPPSPCKG